MKESFWGIFIVFLGVTGIIFITLFQNLTNTDQHNTELLNEVAEAAMLDAVDHSEYRKTGTLKINREKFVENFIRRFAENADLVNTYVIEIFDVNEVPPKVSLKVSSAKSTTINNLQNETETFTFDVVNNIDAILETKY